MTIQHANVKIPPEPLCCLTIAKTGPGEYRICSGTCSDFLPVKTLLVSDRNPQLLWDLIHDLAGIPLPKVVASMTIQNQNPETPVPQASTLEEQLSKMSSSQIIAKVLSETSYQITISVKSKKSVIRKALQIYATKNSQP